MDGTVQLMKFRRFIRSNYDLYVCSFMVQLAIGCRCLCDLKPMEFHKFFLHELLRETVDRQRDGSASGQCLDQVEE